MNMHCAYEYAYVSMMKGYTNMAWFFAKSHHGSHGVRAGPMMPLGYTLQDGAQLCECGFINHEISPMN